MMLGKLQRAHPTLRGHFAPAYLVGSNMLRAYLFFIYGYIPAVLCNCDSLCISTYYTTTPFIRILYSYSIHPSLSHMCTAHLNACIPLIAD